MNSPTPTESRYDTMRNSIRTRRLMLHRIAVKAQELHASPVANGMDASQCRCHPPQDFNISLAKLAGHDIYNIAAVRPARVVALASRIECNLKARLGDPYEPAGNEAGTRQALQCARDLLDAALLARKHLEIERKSLNRVISENRRDARATAGAVNDCLVRNAQA